MPDYRFEIALSFAGQDRVKVREVAELLRAAVGDGKVFFDEWFEAEIAGPGSRHYLQEIYGTKTRLVIACLSKEYNERPWTRWEWEAISALEGMLTKEERFRFLPIRFSEGDVVGIFNTAIAPDVSARPADKIAQLLLDRLVLAGGHSGKTVSTEDLRTKALQVVIDACAQTQEYLTVMTVGQHDSPIDMRRFRVLWQNTANLVRGVDPHFATVLDEKSFDWSDFRPWNEQSEIDQAIERVRWVFKTARQLLGPKTTEPRPELTQAERHHLETLNSAPDSGYRTRPALKTELRRLRALGLIRQVTGRPIENLPSSEEKWPIGRYFEITEQGRAFLSGA